MASVIASLFSRSRPPPPAGLHATTPSRPPSGTRRPTGEPGPATREALQELPSARDPWVVLQTIPGVIVDRVNVGGSESGQRSNYMAKGASSDENTWTLDGVVITDMAPLSSPTYWDFDQFQEVRINTGGADVRNQTPGAAVDVILRSGTNQYHGSLRAYLANEGLQGKPRPDPFDPAARAKAGAGHDFIFVDIQPGATFVHHIHATPPRRGAELAYSAVYKSCLGGLTIARAPSHSPRCVPSSRSYLTTGSTAPKLMADLSTRAAHTLPRFIRCGAGRHGLLDCAPRRAALRHRPASPKPSLPSRIGHPGNELALRVARGGRGR